MTTTSKASAYVWKSRIIGKNNQVKKTEATLTRCYTNSKRYDKERLEVAGIALS